MKTEVVVALIALTGVIISGSFALLNLWIQRRLNEVKEHQSKNDISQVENNVLEKLVPLFEKKDLALDRIADIMEEQSKRLGFMELENKELVARLDQKCEAPILIMEIKRLQDQYDKREVREGIISGLLEKVGEKEGTIKRLEENNV